jgi:hypothetical protein
MEEREGNMSVMEEGEGQQQNHEVVTRDLETVVTIQNDNSQEVPRVVSPDSISIRYTCST